MAIKSQPWPYVPGEGPTYSAEDWRRMYRTFGGPGAEDATCGVILTTVDALRVLPTDPATMSVRVGAGSAFINGLWASSDQETLLTLASAHPTYGRYDAVVFRSDATSKTAAIVLKTGTPGPSPTPPALDQTGTPFYEIPLAEIEVPAGATSISLARIADTRRFHNAAADYSVLPARTVDAVTRGEVVYWHSPPGTGDPYGADPLWVCAYASRVSLAPVAGVALHTAAAGQPLAVLTRGLWRFRYAHPTVPVKPFDLLRASTMPREVDVFQSSETDARFVGLAVTGLDTLPGYVWVYVNPAAWCAAPREWRISRSSASNATTTSTSFVDVPDLVFPTFRPRGVLLEADVQATISNSGAGNVTAFAIAVNGSAYPTPLWAGANGASYVTPVRGRYRFTLSPASLQAGFTLSLQWKTSAGTATLYGQASGYVPLEVVLREVLGSPAPAIGQV